MHALRIMTVTLSYRTGDDATPWPPCPSPWTMPRCAMPGPMPERNHYWGLGISTRHDRRRVTGHREIRAVTRTTSLDAGGPWTCPVRARVDLTTRQGKPSARGCAGWFRLPSSSTPAPPTDPPAAAPPHAGQTHLQLHGGPRDLSRDLRGPPWSRGAGGHRASE